MTLIFDYAPLITPTGARCAVPLPIKGDESTHYPSPPWRRVVRKYGISCQKFMSQSTSLPRTAYFSLNAYASSLTARILALWIAVLAVDRTVSPRFKGDFALFLTIRTDRLVHLPRSPAETTTTLSKRHFLSPFWVCCEKEKLSVTRHFFPLGIWRNLISNLGYGMCTKICFDNTSRRNGLNLLNLSKKFVSLC